ncbi:tryptophan-rich sensory protein [Natranaerofaba carboxydovora]|uniref:tryptophan-rich sensory protein n=1 Tax=Natranaerofaba carboxydovora TaxID=2742683 RepID=UPI001F148A08|nr:tryptophan-rich sensory protein [Natranaerofaba carboxydovora]UMZ72911.1 TspO/MBR family protein [Natranaerofaba carboxydovora]
MDARIRSYTNITALVVMLIVNFVASNFSINNLSTEEVSEIYPVLFTPAGYVFAIWGLIYLLLIGFVIYQALPEQANNSMINSIGFLFAVSSLLNVIWIFLWHYLIIPLSLLVMLLLLATLIVIYFKINDEKLHVSKLDRILVKLPFNIYLGWIGVATIANFNILLNDLGILGIGTVGSMIWTMLMIAIGAFIALAITQKRGDYIIALVFAWAFIGIGVRNGSEYILVTITAWAAAIAIIFFLGWITATGQAQKNL